MTCPAHRLSGVEAAFARIQRERMADVPLLNLALAVQAVGFRDWEGKCLGVLVTPWFMNLMLLAGDAREWADLPLGTKIDQAFPSGHYEFILGEEEGIGRYLMCSLFSPVFEFGDQAAAVATAEAVMEGLLDEANRDEVSTRESEIREIWSGGDEAAGTGAVTVGEDESRPTLKERIERPMSRRDVLRGAFLGGGE